MKFRTTQVIAAALLAASGPALAQQAGDWLVRVGPAHVNPDSSSGVLGTVGANARVDVGSDTQLGLSVTWMITDNLGLGILAATPFKHDINGTGDLAAAGKIGETKHLPPTFSLQYFFDTGSTFRPYVGAGINYTTFFSERTVGLGSTRLALSDSWGYALELGADIEVSDRWFLNGQFRYLDISTRARLSGAITDTTRVRIDPWVFMLGVGMRF